MKKKILITLIAVFTILFAFGMINASAEKEGIYTYTVSDGKATITRCNTSVSGEIVIPDSLGGYPVISIGWGAFEDCSAFTSVTIPNSVTNIDVRAFSNCSNLKRVTMPNSVINVGVYAFQRCYNLERVDITDISAWYKINFQGFDANPLSCAQNLYLNGILVTNITIPDDITSIGNYAFHGCSSITNVTIGDNVTSIGEYAFYNCSSLASITIGKSVSIIGENAFYNCKNLKCVDVSNLSAWCKIKFHEFDSNPSSYAQNLYSNGNIVTSVTIPNDITSIGEYAFSNCKSLVDIKIPDSVISIGNSAFNGCIGITNIIIPNSVTSIGESAFQGCESIESLIIPNSVDSIGEYAFSNCKNLVNVTIPDSVTNIGEAAFSYCKSLQYVSIGKGIESIPAGAFSSPIYTAKIKCVALPTEIKYIRNSAFGGCEIETVFYAGSESQWTNISFYNNNESLTNAKIVYNIAKKTYKLETNCDAKLDDITDYAIFTMPTVANDGMTLTGWYDNVTLSGEPVTFPYYGDATTLYAAWTDRTGKSFDDAFIAKANQEYTATTTENGQLVYFEFVPRFSKEYRFYTTGSKDTYGYLYNSNKSQIASNDDSGDGNNFYISYNLTAGQTYYIAAKLYSGTGTFTFVVEEPVDYRINEITIKDMSGNSLQAIPTGTFLATVSFTNVSSSEDTVIVLAQYTDVGAFTGLMYIQTEDVPTGSTIKLSIPVDNSNGDVAKLKAFCWESFASLTPMGNSASFPAE